uniref:EamA domain-containing protein n=1 Tax=Cyanothece sp. (strain PCC 7425 / ATCC 29141) TaxID=395961 RepID=B8HY21_CYAP4
MAAIGYGRIGRTIPPLGLNLAKGVVAIALIGLTLLLRRDGLPSLNGTGLSLLLLSGLLGIGLGDSFYFAALRYLGARRTLLLGTLSPPLTALIALIFLQEVLPLTAWLGIGITLAGVTWVISERTQPDREAPHHLLGGIGFAVLSALAQAIGAVLSRTAFTATDFDPLWATLWRLLAGVAMLLLWGSGRGQLGSWIKGFNSSRTIGILCLAAFAGTYLGIWLQQTALKYSDAGIAQTLSATSPLFILPISALAGEKVSLRALVGALVAVAGIAILLSWG